MPNAPISSEPCEQPPHRVVGAGNGRHLNHHVGDEALRQRELSHGAVDDLDGGFEIAHVQLHAHAKLPQAGIAQLGEHLLVQEIARRVEAHMRARMPRVDVAHELHGFPAMQQRLAARQPDVGDAAALLGEGVHLVAPASRRRTRLVVGPLVLVEAEVAVAVALQGQRERLAAEVVRARFARR